MLSALPFWDFICVYPCLSVVGNEIEKEESGFSAPDLAD
jgi:hypothetical protein